MPGSTTFPSATWRMQGCRPTGVTASATWRAGGAAVTWPARFGSPRPDMRPVLPAVLAAIAAPRARATLTGVKWPALDPPCKNGEHYSPSRHYGDELHVWRNDLLARGGWRGAVLGPSGTKVYGIPNNASTVLEVDLTTRSVLTFGRLGVETSPTDCSGALHCGEEKWIDGVLARNGHIVGIPYSAEAVLDIDTEARTATTWGVVVSKSRRKWVGGVLAPNGLVYAIPFDTDSVLEIDPTTHALRQIGSLGNQPCKWYGGVLAANGKVMPATALPLPCHCPDGLAAR